MKAFSQAGPILRLALLFLMAATGASLRAFGATAWTFRVLDGSTLIDDCPICGRPTIPRPLHGTYELRLTQEGPLGSEYAIENVHFTADQGTGSSYKLTGSGTFTVGGEVAVIRDLKLQLTIDDGTTSKLCTFTNYPALSWQRLWPMMQFEDDQSNGTFTKVYRLNIAAAPIREIWFSTGSGFHPALGPEAGNAISGGDLISSSGQIVASNASLTAGLGIMPLVPDIGLDAVDVMPGGQLAFSSEKDIFSETLGQLHEGDLLSGRGGVVYSYSALAGAFGPQPPVQDQGLDAFYASPDGVVYFSIRRDFFSETSGQLIRHGDLLTTGGKVAKSNQDLLARFNATEPSKDYGLDAIWIWENGEIWFSTEEGFQTTDFQSYGPGDILSDQGYAVFRNLELLQPFAPVEDASNFGLDSLFIVSDAAAPQDPPKLQVSAGSAAIQLHWSGKGRVFQVLRAGDPAGPYAPLSPIFPATDYTDTAPLPSAAYYRLLQW